MFDIMKTRLFSRTNGKNAIDTFGNVLMFKNCYAYPHGPAKQKIIEKFLRTLLMFSYCMPILTDQQGRKNELQKRL